MAQDEGRNASSQAATAPDPEDPRKPDSPTDISKPSWIYVAKKTLREFSSDQCTDLAAALTYYGTLAIFPALLAFVSIIGLFGDPEKTTGALIDLASGLVPATTLDAIREPVANLASSPAAGLGFITGILGALWSASGFVGAFSRALNRVYNIQEGRPVWKLRPVTLLVTVVAVLGLVVVALLLVLSGPIAEQIGALVGLGDTALLIWNIAKWPVIVLIAVLLIALLYYATPNVKQPKFRWMSMGSLVALLVWAVASAGFAFYVANFSNYNATYGSIGGVIVFLLWLWISNNALLFGAELDAEIERGRELEAGIAAEEQIQLPPRDTRQSDKKAKKHDEDVERGRELRESIPEEERAERVREDGGDEPKRPDPDEIKNGKENLKTMKKMRRGLARRQHSQVIQRLGREDK
jgi:membrane protein